MKTYFAFAIADSMFPPECVVVRRPMTANEVCEALPDCIPALNPSHAATIDAMRTRYSLDISIPETAPRVALGAGDAVIVMSVRGLPRLDATRHEYTPEEIASATFAFAKWSVQ